MIYFARDGQIEVCESTDGVARLEARGFVRISAELHRALWRRKHDRALAELKQDAAQPAIVLQERAVGEAPKLSGGWKLFRV